MKAQETSVSKDYVVLAPQPSNLIYLSNEANKTVSTTLCGDPKSFSNFCISFENGIASVTFNINSDHGTTKEILKWDDKNVISSMERIIEKLDEKTISDLIIIIFISIQM